MYIRKRRPARDDRRLIDITMNNFETTSVLVSRRYLFILACQHLRCSDFITTRSQYTIFQIPCKLIYIERIRVFFLFLQSEFSSKTSIAL